jgi:hypothetical protein
MTRMASFGKILNPKRSIWITFLSLGGLIAQLSLTPTMPILKEEIEEIPSKETIPRFKEPPYEQYPSQHQDKQRNITDIFESTWKEYIQSGNTQIIVSKTPIQNSSPSFSLDGIQSPRKWNQLEIQTKPNDSLTYIVKTQTLESADEKQSLSKTKQELVWAGVNFQQSKYFSTQIMGAGTQYYTTNSWGVTKADPSINNEAFNKNYELQANFTPSQKFQLQTSIFRNSRDITGLSNTNPNPNGGKINLTFGESFFQVSMKYVFQSQTSNVNLPIALTNGLDNATVGMNLNIPNSRYSFFLGNQFYNVFTNNNAFRDQYGDRKIPNMSASIQGKFRGTTIYLNMKNQILRDAFGFPIFLGAASPTQWMEIATSLGMEYNF